MINVQCIEVRVEKYGGGRRNRRLHFVQDLVHVRFGPALIWAVPKPNDEASTV